ncbi:hypothetical protein ACFFHU_19060 [Plantactinospora siamensis]|uniref:Uncharacterized protein n=1 Tax=Plantactinospora siamensis TaxID=555372 RepID=A0ABV6P138_9ACTN
MTAPDERDASRPGFPTAADWVTMAACAEPGGRWPVWSWACRPAPADADAPDGAGPPDHEAAPGDPA